MFFNTFRMFPGSIYCSAFGGSSSFSSPDPFMQKLMFFMRFIRYLRLYRSFLYSFVFLLFSLHSLNSSFEYMPSASSGMLWSPSISDHSPSCHLLLVLISTVSLEKKKWTLPIKIFKTIPAILPNMPLAEMCAKEVI